LCFAANNFKEPWNLFPCPKSLWAFSFPGVIETCCSDKDFWFHRHLQTLLQQKSWTCTVCRLTIYKVYPPIPQIVFVLGMLFGNIFSQFNKSFFGFFLA
jgi:hypothetical protein